MSYTREIIIHCPTETELEARKKVKAEKKEKRSA